jgi:hypothetical protein
MLRFDKLLPIHEPIAARLNVRHFCDASCVSRLQKYAASTKKTRLRCVCKERQGACGQRSEYSDGWALRLRSVVKRCDIVRIKTFADRICIKRFFPFQCRGKYRHFVFVLR